MIEVGDEVVFEWRIAHLKYKHQNAKVTKVTTSVVWVEFVHLGKVVNKRQLKNSVLLVKGKTWTRPSFE